MYTVTQTHQTTKYRGVMQNVKPREAYHPTFRPRAPAWQVTKWVDADRYIVTWQEWYRDTAWHR